MKSIKSLLVPVFAFMALFSSVQGQKSIQDSVISFSFFTLEYKSLIPAGDLGDRFGYSNAMGAQVGFKFANNLYLAGDCHFLFGSSVRERVAQNVTFDQVLEDGSTHTFAIGVDGRLYRILFFERGMTASLVLGKIFPLTQKGNRNSGLFLEAGPQFMETKIRIETQGDKVPNLSPEMRKGYDRLTNGIGLVEGIGYRYHGNNRFFNFVVGLTASQVFTENRRTINYDTGVHDDKQRLDMMLGLRVGWSLLIYHEAPDDYYYF